jgi:broad specificity phosphatase PhoE
MEPARRIAKWFGVPHRSLPALREIKTGQNGGTNVEDEAAFEARVGKAIDEIVADHSGSQIAVVTHSGTLRAIVRILLGLPLSALSIPSIAPGSLVILTKDSSGNWSSRA